jgi:hypothetical protein
MEDHENSILFAPKRTAWNKGKLIGQSHRFGPSITNSVFVDSMIGRPAGLVPLLAKPLGHKPKPANRFEVVNWLPCRAVAPLGRRFEDEIAQRPFE